MRTAYFQPGKVLSGIVWMVIGSTVVFGLIVFLNRFAEPPEKQDREDVTRFQVEKKPPPEEKQVIQEPEPPKKPQRESRPLEPLKGLGSDIGSIDVSIPQFDFGSSDIDQSLLGDMKDVVMTDETVDVAPKPVQQAAINYPPEARAQGTTGYVVVNLLIGKDGSVQKARLLESEPGDLFDSVALQAVKNWRFQPAMYKGEAVKVWAQQRIEFQLS